MDEPSEEVLSKGQRGEDAVQAAPTGAPGRSALRRPRAAATELTTKLETAIKNLMKVNATTDSNV